MNRFVRGEREDRDYVLVVQCGGFDLTDEIFVIKGGEGNVTDLRVDIEDGESNARCAVSGIECVKVNSRDDRLRIPRDTSRRSLPREFGGNHN